ncbi:MAG: O-methyltransferase [Actinomycetota bacterium]|nr:O-methyltransferase [Actinomycetota bacterium]MDQ2956456.1 O-methyltransferase [Actinomycetota bacterium]
MPSGVLPAHVQLMPLIAGKWLSQALAALTRLEVFEKLGDGPCSVSELATLTDTDADRLGRVLRAAEAMGVVARAADGSFSLTELGKPFRRNDPCSVRELTLYLADPVSWLPFAHLTHTLRTGEPAFEELYETDLFSYLAADPDLSHSYQGGWASLTDELGPQAVELYDFSQWPVIADVGGGHGRMLLHLLRANPGIRGILLDRPEVLDGARRSLADEPELARMRLAAITLPTGTLPAADAYLMKNTLHCYDDSAVLAMLEPIRQALSDDPRRRLLIIETVVPEDDSYDWSKFIDIEVMTMTGGRERTREEWQRLLLRAGLRLTAVTRLTPPQSLLEVERAAELPDHVPQPDSRATRFGPSDYR